jgi:hypothetical protein
LFLRPCFLVVDPEFAGCISTRKLVIETAKFNVITAYSFAEALLTLERFPRVQGCVVSTSNNDAHVAFLREVRSLYPEIKLILTGHQTNNDAPYDVHVDGYSPERLLTELRSLFPAVAATFEEIELKLEEEAGKA